MDAPLSAPIFIGGTGRSGTTALARLLGHHPDILSVRWESQFIVSPGGLVDLVRSGFEQPALDRFLSNLRTRWFRRVLRQGQPNEYEAGLCADVTSDELEAAIEAFLERLSSADLPAEGYEVARVLVDGVFGPAARRTGATRWAEKTPRNVLYAEELWRMFPDMRLVNMVRDGRDVASSMVARQFWPIGASPDLPSLRPYGGEVTAEKAASYWAEVLRLSRIHASRIPAANYLEIRLEDLVEHTEPILERLCSFLGVPLAPELFSYNLGRSHRGRWREELSAEEARRIHELVGDALVLEGYPVDEESPVGS